MRGSHSDIGLIINHEVAIVWDTTVLEGVSGDGYDYAG